MNNYWSTALYLSGQLMHFRNLQRYLLKNFTTLIKRAYKVLEIANYVKMYEIIKILVCFYYILLQFDRTAEKCFWPVRRSAKKVGVA